MKTIVWAKVFLLAATCTGAAQELPSTVLVPPGGANHFCYYNGLAYSENALLTIEVTHRRESPVATQKAMLECRQSENAETLVWVRVADE